MSGMSGAAESLAIAARRHRHQSWLIASGLSQIKAPLAGRFYPTRA
jgi:hypothetical protein